MHLIPTFCRLSSVPGAVGLVALVMSLFACGCGGDARLELASADAMEVIAAEHQKAIDEYHASVQAGDAEREAAIVEAFLARVRRDAGDDPSELDAHGEAFKQALAKIQTDRAVEQVRHRAAADNVEALLEIADGLRRAALESLTLGDEVHRYVQSLIEARRRAQQEIEHAE